MLALPEVKDESRIVGVPLPERRMGYGTEHVQYGAYQVAASYCGFSVPPRAFLGEWQHGWAPPEMNFHPEAVTANDGLSLHRRSTHSYLVAREDQEHYLKQEGYASVHSVGLPIIYQRSQEVERLPGSLLVMPVHSLDYTTHDWNFEQFAREIHTIRNRFSSVVACVSPSCFRRGYWVEAFQERGIPLISGADYFDANSYQRLVRLFGRFDFMTTNGFGSHIA